MSLGECGGGEVHMQDKIIQDVQDTSHLVIYSTTLLLPRNEGHRNYMVLVFPLVGSCLNSIILKKMSMATRMAIA